jgi:hypothetical protein
VTRLRILAGLLAVAIGTAVVVVIWMSTDASLFRWATTAVVLLVVLLVLLEPGALKELPFKSLELPGGLKFELHDTTADAEEDLDSETRSTELSQRWLDVRWKLEYKLAYLAKHTLPDHFRVLGEENDAQPFATIGSLKHDKFLSKDDATVATLTLALSPTDLRAMQEDDVRELLGAAETLAGALRVRVFRGFLRKVIEGRGWVSVEDGLRWVVTANERQVMVVPLFGRRNSRLVASHAKKLAKVTAMPTLIVLPMTPGTTTSAPAPDGRGVVQFDQFAAAVEASTAPASV